jgi:hypothetical protein
MTEIKAPRVFCGVLPSGTSMAILQFVMGKTDLTKQKLDHAFSEGQTIELMEPLIIHRVMGMDQDAKTGQQRMVITHQIIEDPYWPVRREVKLPLKLSHFLSVRMMDDTNAKDLDEIGRYENSLKRSFTQNAGLVLPMR